MEMVFVFLTNIFGWLERNDGNPSGKKLGKIYDAIRLNAGGIYRLLWVIGIALFVFFFLVKAMKVMLNRGPMAAAEFKSYVLRWAVCIIIFSSVFTIVGIALKFGGLI